MPRILLIALLFFCSCGHSSKPTVAEPDDLLPKEKMVPVLADVHLLEATLAIRSPMPQHRPHLPMEFAHDSIPPVSLEPQKKDTLPYYNIFKRYDITRKQYEASMAWYSANPEKLNELYDLVIVELTRRQAEDRTGKKIISSDSLPKK